MALLDPRKRWMADSGVVWYRAENESQTRVIDCSSHLACVAQCIHY